MLQFTDTASKVVGSKSHQMLSYRDNGKMNNKCKLPRLWKLAISDEAPCTVSGEISRHFPILCGAPSDVVEATLPS